jgi:hypothetical protein
MPQYLCELLTDTTPPHHPARHCFPKFHASYSIYSLIWSTIFTKMIKYAEKCVVLLNTVYLQLDNWTQLLVNVWPQCLFVCLTFLLAMSSLIILLCEVSTMYKSRGVIRWILHSLGIPSLRTYSYTH